MRSITELVDMGLEVATADQGGGGALAVLGAVVLGAGAIAAATEFRGADGLMHRFNIGLAQEDVGRAWIDPEGNCWIGGWGGWAYQQQARERARALLPPEEHHLLDGAIEFDNVYARVRERASAASGC